MLILGEKIPAGMLSHIESEMFFDDMIKCVVDIDRELVAVNADLHSDLEELLLENGSAHGPTGL